MTRWETEQEPSWEVLLELAVGVMQYDREEVEGLVYGLSRALGPVVIAGAPEASISLSAEDLREVRRVSGPVGRAATDSLEDDLLCALRAAKLQKARQEALRLCATLLNAAPQMRRLYVEQETFQTWSIAERLCDLSQREADNAAQALELAQLACRVAEQLPGEGRWRARVRGYCQAFVAHAWLVLGELEKAAEIFLRALELWGQGEAGDPERILAEWRLLDLEASLRREQGRFGEALDLHGRARAAAQEPCLQILLNEAVTLDRTFQAEKVIEVLREAASHPGGPWLRFLAGKLRTANLCRLGRYEEAEEELRETRDCAIALRDIAGVLQVQWLSGRVAAGLGESEKSLEAFRAVRRDLRERTIAYEFALASLEEARVLFDLGLPAQVREIVVDQMAWIYDEGAAAVHREAMAALTFFREAVEEERATADLARQVHDFLVRAENDPDLHFEGVQVAGRASR